MANARDTGRRSTQRAEVGGRNRDGAAEGRWGSTNRERSTGGKDIIDIANVDGLKGITAAMSIIRG